MRRRRFLVPVVVIALAGGIYLFEHLDERLAPIPSGPSRPSGPPVPRRKPLDLHGPGVELRAGPASGASGGATVHPKPGEPTAPTGSARPPPSDDRLATPPPPPASPPSAERNDPPPR